MLLAAAIVCVPAVGVGQTGESAPRKSLLPLVQPLWSELSSGQQQVLGPFESQWNTLPMVEKRAWMSLASRFPRMSAAEQRRVEKRIAEWAALSPDQRKIARQNYRLAKKSLAGGEQRVATWEQYQSMTPEQRAVLERNGWTSNTAARHAGARTALAKEAAQPISDPPRFGQARAPGTSVGVTSVVPTRH